MQEVVDTRVSWLTLMAPYKVELLGKSRKWRTCPLWEITAEQLRHHMQQRRDSAGQDDYLFVNRYGRPLSRSGIAEIIPALRQQGPDVTGESERSSDHRAYTAAHDGDAPVAIRGGSERDS